VTPKTSLSTTTPPARPPDAASDWTLAFALASALTVILAFSPLTVSLDDIKIPPLLGLGGLCLALAAWIGPSRRASEDLWLAALGLAAVLSALMANQRWMALRELGTLGAAAGLYLALAWSVRGEKRAFAATWTLMGLALAEFLFALFHFAGGMRWLRETLFDDLERLTEGQELAARMLSTFADSGDLLGTFLNEDFFSGFAAGAIPLAAAMALAAKRQRSRALCLFGALLGIFCVLIALSKESLAGMALGLGVFGALAIWIAGPGARPSEQSVSSRGASAWGTLAKVAALTAAALTLFAGLTLWHVWPRFLREVETVGTAFSSRAVIWRGALAIWSENPIFGAGPGNFRAEFPLKRSPDYFEHEISNVTLTAHNLYLDALNETGALGFLAFLGFLALWALGCWAAVRNREASPRERLLAAGYLGAFAAVAVQSVSSPWARWPAGTAALALFLGLGSGASRSIQPAPSEEAASAKSPLPGRPALRWVAVGAALAFAGMNWAQGLQHFRSMKVYRLGYEAHGIEEYDEAVRHYEKALAIWPDNHSAAYRLGALYTTQTLREPRRSEELLAKASAIYERLDQRWPNYAETPYNRALLERAKALLALEKALRARDANPQAVPEGTFLAQEALAHVDAAIAQARRFRSWSNKFEAWRLLGDMLAEKARLLESSAPEGSPKSEEALDCWLEACLAYDGALLAARRAERLGRAISPDDLGLARGNLLDGLKAAGAYEKALALAEETYLDSPQSDSLAGETLALRLALNDFAGALKTAQRNAADNPLSPIRWSDLATVADMAGQPEVAKMAREKLEKLQLFFKEK
jgi:O-antigen ligase